MIEEVKLTHQTDGGSLIRSAAAIEYKDGRIWFLQSPYALRHEIKAMTGSKWHGFEDRPRKIWSVLDCQRNRFQLGFLKGVDVYAWFDRPVVKQQYDRPLMPHQMEMSDHFLTYHFGIMAAEMGCGKTLSAQEVMERSGIKEWFWAGPKTSIPNIEREFRKWALDPSVHVELMTYEALKRVVASIESIPQGLICDEASRCKTPGAQRSQGVQQLANMIRDKYGNDGYVIEMSGTPSPKTPCDWWNLCEIAWPGFLKEGSVKAEEQRLGFMADMEFNQGMFKKRVGWRDDERKCNTCGMFPEEHGADHTYEPSKNEVSYLYERLKGLVIIKHKKDCLNLPDKRYRVVHCKPSASTLRAAKAIVGSADSAILGMTLLRELSDGFQYREVDAGTVTCTHCKGNKTVEEWFDPESQQSYQSIELLKPDFLARLQSRTVACPVCKGKGETPQKTRVAKEFPCPKEAALVDLLDECIETGRIVIFAGFTGSVDRIVKVCHREGWSVVRCDGRGWQVTEHDNNLITDEKPLDFWSNMDHLRVAFVAQAESGGMSFSLVESRMAVYWSNSFKPEYRIQSEDRIHRIGTDINKGVTIVDLIHLPTDARVLEVIRDNRRLELMTMGALTEGINWDE